MHAPIIIFAFTRKDKLENLVNSLKKCPEFDSSEVYIYVDGPRNNKEKEAVAAVIEYIKYESINNKHLIVRDTNYGLKKSIFSGVTEITKKYGRAIILEDDLTVAPWALSYFNECLEKYKDNEKIYSISGYIHDVKEFKDRNEAIAMRFANPWGWATWDRSWKTFKIDNNADLITNLKSKFFRDSFNIGGINNYSELAALNIKGLVNSWFIGWYYHIFINDGISIFPPTTCVLNNGIGSKNATHASKLNPTNMLFTKNNFAERKFIIPNNPKINFHAVDLISKSREAKILRTVATLGRLKRKIKAFTNAKNH